MSTDNGNESGNDNNSVTNSPEIKTKIDNKDMTSENIPESSSSQQQQPLEDNIVPVSPTLPHRTSSSASEIGSSLILPLSAGRLSHREQHNTGPSPYHVDDRRPAFLRERSRSLGSHPQQLSAIPFPLAGAGNVPIVPHLTSPDGTAVGAGGGGGRGTRSVIGGGGGLYGTLAPSPPPPYSSASFPSLPTAVNPYFPHPTSTPTPPTPTLIPPLSSTTTTTTLSSSSSTLIPPPPPPPLPTTPSSASCSPLILPHTTTTTTTTSSSSSSRNAAVESAIQSERERAKELESSESNMTSDELRLALRRERSYSERLAADLASLWSAAVESQAEAEVCEEGRINGLMRRLDRVQREKGRIIVELEREEEMLTNNLQKKLFEVRREKAILEKQIEREQALHREAELKLLSQVKSQQRDDDDDQRKDSIMTHPVSASLDDTKLGDDDDDDDDDNTNMEC